VNWFEFNANGHYLFQDDEDLALYGLGGLNLTRVSVDFPENQFFGGGSVSDSEIGLNVGAGLEYGVGFGNLYAEAKYVISSADHLAITGGVRIPIGD
jgi:opacity protein-like surface antigen